MNTLHIGLVEKLRKVKDNLTEQVKHAKYSSQNIRLNKITDAPQTCSADKL